MIISVELPRPKRHRDDEVCLVLKMGALSWYVSLGEAIELRDQLKVAVDEWKRRALSPNKRARR